MAMRRRTPDIGRTSGLIAFCLSHAILNRGPIALHGSVRQPPLARPPTAPVRGAIGRHIPPGTGFWIIDPPLSNPLIGPHPGERNCIVGQALVLLAFYAVINNIFLPEILVPHLAPDA